MKVRTVGPILMMALGALVMIVPSSGLASGLVVDTCDTTVQLGTVSTCCPVETNPPQAGVVQPQGVDPGCCDVVAPEGIVSPCETVDTTIPLDTVAPDTTDVGSGGGSAGGGLPSTGSTDFTYVVIGGALVLAGGALLVTGRRPKAA